MAVGRISGPLLKQNLLREGVNLAFETDLLYLDVNNQRIGINNATPQYDLDVIGVSRTPTLEVTTLAEIGDVRIQGNTISSATSTLALGTLDNVVYQNRLTIDSIDIEGNRIRTNTTNANLELAPQGTGRVEIHSDMNVQGDIYATGNITADGVITIGDADTDYIEFNSELSSNIIPSQTDTYTLGSDPDSGGKRWNDIWVQNFYAEEVNSASIEADGIDLILRQGNIYYVSENGDDIHSGTHPQDPYASLTQALSVASSGDTIHITPGTYTEIFPLTVPAGVTVKGHSMRSVKIIPTVATQNNDAFLLTGEVTIEDITISDFYSPGYAFKFASAATVTTRSPYIRNVSVITTGSVTTVEDPRGFNQGDAGKGALLDGSVMDTSSKEAGCLFHSVTFITPGVDAITLTNGVRVEWLNCFTYFADKGIYAIDGALGKKSAGETALRVSDLTGSYSASETITYYDTDGVTVLATGTISSVDSDGKIYISGKSEGFETPTSRIGKTVAGNGAASIDQDIKKFGSASLDLGGSGDYLTIVAQNDFGFGTDDFTIETWYYSNGALPATNETLFDFRAGIDADIAPYVYTTNTGDIVYYTDSAAKISGASALTASTWHHIAITRSGTDTKLFVDGTQVGSTYTDNNNYGVAKPLTIGAKHDGTESANAHFDDFRIQKGVAQYTSNFIAPIVNLYSTEDTVLLMRFNGDDSSAVFTDETIQQQDIRFSGGAVATQFTLADYSDFGAEVRMIGSACVYGNYGLYGNGPGVIVYAIGQNLAYIGNGKEVTNDPTTVIQANEVVALNNAKMRYNSVDHRGDFRVGDLFYVNQDTGQVTFSAANFNVDTDTGLTFTDGVNTTSILADKIDTGNLRISGNTLESLSGDVNFTAASDQINLNNNVNINGDLDVTGNVTIGGNIVIGDEVTDNIQIVAGIASDIKPSVTSTFNLGLANKIWKNLYVESAYVDDILITDNYIRTTTSDANLELRANGAGFITIDNFNIDSYTISSTASDIIIQPGSEYTKINSTGSLKLPTGDIASRPTAEAGIIRYNSELTRFEGYDGSDWIKLNGLQDVDGDTRITAEATQGANDNIIRFIVEDTVIGTLDSVKLDVNRVTVDDIEIDTNVITTINTDVDLQFSAQGTGSVVLEDFAFSSNTITNVVEDGVTTFVNTNNGYVKIAGSNGFVLPVGTSLDRPNPAYTEVGMLRFNTADGRVEAYDGSVWGSVAGQTGSISRIDAEDIAITMAVIFG
jgi:hypothetical protein